METYILYKQNLFSEIKEENDIGLELIDGHN